MDKIKLNQIVTSLIIISFAVIWRLLPHTANFSPIIAIAIFSGMFFSNRKIALITPLLAMLLSDLFLGFHVSMLAVYLSVFIIVFAGFWLKNRTNLINSLGTVLSSSVLFYLITNFYYWAFSGLYSPDFAGLLDSYYRALPFFRTALAGDLVFSAIAITIYKLPVLKAIKA